MSDSLGPKKSLLKFKGSYPKGLSNAQSSIKPSTQNVETDNKSN